MIALQQTYEYQLKNGCNGFSCKNLYCDPKNFKKTDLKLLSLQLAILHTKENQLCPNLSPLAFDSSIYIKNQILYKEILESQGSKANNFKIFKEFFRDLSSFQYMFAFDISSKKSDLKFTDTFFFDDELINVFMINLEGNSYIAQYVTDFSRLVHKKLEYCQNKRTFHFLRGEIVATIFSKLICSKKYFKTFNILVKNILCNNVLLFSQYISRLPNIMNNFVNSCKNMMTLFLTEDPHSYKSSEFQSICVLLQNISINYDQSEIFYHEMLTSFLDIEHEFKKQKQKKKFSFLYTPAVLSSKFKKKCIFYKFPLTDGYIEVKIRRSQLLIDSKQFFYINKEDLISKTLQIKFENEFAYDLGGVKREYFSLISKAYKSNEFHFLKRINNEFYWFNHPNEDSDHIWFKLLGILAGLCVRQNVLLYIKFPLLLYKALLKREITMNDLIELYPDTIKNLKLLKQYPSSVLDDLDLRFTFTKPNENSKKASDIPLIENGEKIKVVKENIDCYIKAYCDCIISILFSENYNSFRDGFYKIHNEELSNFFSPYELSEIIGGRSDIDWKEFRSSIQYINGYTENSLTIQYFWDIFENSFSEKERKKLLFFITSLKNQPIGGFFEHVITIEKSENIKLFPTSHTCSMILVLPNYQNRNILENRLIYCINNIKGFGNI